jgi:hypothetical protein
MNPMRFRRGMFAVVVGLVPLVLFAVGGCEGPPALDPDEPLAIEEALQAAAPACGQPGALPLAIAPVPNHEDAALTAHLDLHALNLASYAQIGVYVLKEDGVDYFPTGPGFAIGATLQTLTPGACFDRVFSNLNPGKTYQVCLNGLASDFTSTGPFACLTLKTAARKPETALLVTNSKTSSINSTIKSWVAKVKSRNSTLTLKQVTVADNISVQSLWNIIHSQYLTSNLTTVILGSPGLPLPIVDDLGSQVAYSGVYTTLTRGIGVDDGFLNPTDDLFEVSIASWRTASVSVLKSYLTRVLDFYGGKISFNKRLLVANAMVPADLSLQESDFLDSRYGTSNHDYVGGITAYFNDAQGAAWRKRFASLLAGKSYDLMLLDAHGAPTFHYPCDAGGCVDPAFIHPTNPRIKLAVATSCSIGNLGPASTPMGAYVFDGRSLGGIGAEITFTSNGMELNVIKAALESGAPLGRPGRRYGLTTYGDPFLTL